MRSPIILYDVVAEIRKKDHGALYLGRKHTGEIALVRFVKNEKE